ncbi:uncharacterized protein TrAFT101_010452 [Trichoderma asperellum]|uniref:uncharacterized protein n=1 Tax=Trichoderma asperellum TaxID=101201 RepID=UPI003333D6B5|nr:hypothetical protein TrAFT101_010452 [Trichoderma asperellum]
MLWNKVKFALVVAAVVTPGLARTVKVFAEIIDNEVSQSTTSTEDQNTFKDIEQLLDNQNALTHAVEPATLQCAAQSTMNHCLSAGCYCTSDGSRYTFNCRTSDAHKTACKTAYDVGQCWCRNH